MYCVVVMFVVLIWGGCRCVGVSSGDNYSVV